MKQLILIALLFASGGLFAQSIELTQEFQAIQAINDTTYEVQTFAVYSVEFNEDLARIDTVLQPEKTVVLDSAGVVDYLFTSTFNEQNQQAAIAARAFNIVRYNSNVAEANNLISQITNAESNYFEESAKRFASVLTGTYRIRYDSAGVTKNDLFDLALVSTPAHPDGRILRITNQANGEFFTVQAWHRFKWRIANWPYGEDVFVWDRNSPAATPIYRPQFSFADRSDLVSLIRKR